MKEHEPLGDLTGKVALITGAASQRGIGRQTAITLADLGAAVAIADVNAEGLAEVVQIIESRGGKAIGVTADVSEKKQVEQLVKTVEEQLGYVDILVNLPGITQSAFFLDIEEEDWDRMYKNNIKTYFLTSQAVLRPMIERHWGRIINISSSAARDGGGFGGAHYASSKAAVLGLTRALAREMAQHGITVNSVAPAAIDTNMLLGKMSKEGKDFDEWRASRAASIPLKRLGTTEEVADLIAFLATKGAFITGAVIDINGGKFMAP